MNSESKTHRRLQHGFLGYPRLICTGYMRTPCAESGLVFREAVVWGLRYALCLRPFQHLIEFALSGRRGCKQYAEFFHVRLGAFLMHDCKALHVKLPEEFQGLDEGVVEVGGLGAVQKKSVRAYIPEPDGAIQRSRCKESAIRTEGGTADIRLT